MSQKSVHLAVLLVISIVTVAMGLILSWYPTSAVSGMNSASTKSVSLDGGALASWNLYQNAIFQPVLNMLTVVGVITMGYVVLSKVFKVVSN